MVATAPIRGILWHLAMVFPLSLKEPSTVTKIQETTTQRGKALAGDKALLQVISAGWGSSGYYSPKVLEQAVNDGLFKKGTQMFADHPTDAEEAARPARSVKDLAAVFADDAYYDKKAKAVVAEIAVVPAWAGAIKTLWESIGASILGSATDLTVGEAEGRTGLIVEGLAAIQSVDFVTRAGRGGKIISLLESETNRRAGERGLEEATVNDIRQQLSTALKAKFADPIKKIYIWVKDFDATTVWFEMEGEGGNGKLYAHQYTVTDAVASLTGGPVEVRIVTTYVPVIDAAGRPTQESEEIEMATKPVEETAPGQDDRIRALESERDAALAEAAGARQETAEARSESRAARNEASAREIIAESGGTFDALQTRGLLAGLPVKEGGELDAEAFTTTVKEAAATLAALSGAGKVVGFGATTNPLTEAVTDEDLDALGDAVFN